MAMRRFALLLVLAIAGCGTTPYRAVEPVAFQTTVPRPVLFDVLAREAIAMGYVMEYADPMSTSFQVHSKQLGRPPRRQRRAAPRPGVIRGNLIVVEVTDGGVRVSAVGRNVRADGTMHPRLAAELTLFGQAMRDRAQAFGAQFVAIPAPPSGYGAAPPGYGAAVVQPVPAPLPQPPAQQQQQPAQQQPAQQQPAQQQSPAQGLGNPG